MKIQKHDDSSRGVGFPTGTKNTVPLHSRWPVFVIADYVEPFYRYLVEKEGQSVISAGPPRKNVAFSK